MLNTKRTQIALPTIGVALLVCAALLGVPFATSSNPAFADPKADLEAAEEEAADSAEASEQAQNDLSAAQEAIEQSAADYDEAQAKVDEVEGRIAANTERIEVLEQQIPEQQEASDAACRAIYKMQQDGVGLLDLVLGSKDLGAFFDNLNYLNHVQERNLASIRKLTSMQGELEEKQGELEEQKKEAEADKVAAKEALASAQAAREAAQQAAEEQQRREAEAAKKVAAAKKAVEKAKAEKEAAAKAAAEEAARKAQEEAEQAEREAAANSPASSGEKNESSSLANESADESEEVSAPTADGADWSTDKATFVKKWAPRIDAYLAGYPLAGYGKVFAAKAWDYGVDPRWSPAISCVESTKGKFCFKSHNAWGWGHTGWSSWEEAIDAHVGGLSRGYGYTVTQAAAQKYCPPNWRHWYNTCVSEMAKI